MRILFIGSVKLSQALLKKLIEMQENIVGVVTNSNSNFNSDYVDLSNLCRENSIDCKKVDKINDDETIFYIKQKKPDVIYCFGFSQLLSKKIIAIPSKGVVGFHPAKLPINRGRHPLIWAIALGLTETASTFFYIKEGTDNGDIISQEIVPIYYEDDAKILYERVSDLAQKQLEIFTNELKEGKIRSKKQDETKATYWRKRYKEDGRIDWRMSSKSIYNLVRALTYPYVGAHFEYKGRDIKVWKVEEKVIDGVDNIEPGKIIEVSDDGTFVIKTGDNCIRILDSDIIDVKVGDYI